MSLQSLKVIKRRSRGDIRTRLSHWRYKFLGPSTVHLQHEFCLLITLTFLTNASLISLYKSSFGSAPKTVLGGFLSGDYFYLLVTFACLSRHLLHRILCTTETGTSLSHPLWHLRDHVARIWTWAFSGGHSFDATRWLLTSAHYAQTHTLSPVPRDKEAFAVTSALAFPTFVLQNDLTGSNAGMGMAFSLNAGSVGMAPSIPIHRNAFVANVLLFPFVFVWALFRWVCTRLSSRTKEDVYDLDDWKSSGGGVAGHSHTRSSSLTHADHHRSLKRGSSGGGGSGSGSAGIASSNAGYLNNIPDGDLPKDAPLAHFIIVSRRSLNRNLDRLWEYAPQAQMAIALIVMACIVIFGFYAMPVIGPRGGVRHAWNKWWRRGTDLGYTNFHGMNAQQERSKIELTLNAELMTQKFRAMQQYNNNIADAKEIVYGPWGMLCMILAWSTLGSLIFYGRVILPAPDLTCTVPVVSRGSTKSSKPRQVEKPWSESYKSIITEDRFTLYFKVGILRVLENLFVCAILPQSAYVCKATGHCDADTIMTGYHVGSDENSMFDYLIRDRATSFIIALSVVVVTILMLVAQAVTLDKTILALKGIVSSEASYSFRSHLSAPTGNHGNNRRGGKKAGNLSDIGRGSRWNMTGTTSRIQKYGNLMFANELGPLSTSSILAICSHVHTLYSLFLVLACGFYAAIGKDWYSLVLTFIAIFISTTDIAVTEHDELETIAKELTQGYKLS